MRNYYAILKVKPSGAPSEIKAAFRRLAREWHPDVNDAEEAAERFKEIAEAYATLGNPTKRRAYDASRATLSVAFMDELFEGKKACKTCPTCGGTGIISDDP